MPLDPRDLDNLRIFAAGAASAIPRARATVGALLDEVRRLQSGGCARDQRTTQFCADAVAKDVEIQRLNTALAAVQVKQLPVIEWRGDVGTVGMFHALLSTLGWVLFIPTDNGTRTVVGLGPETGSAGRSACEVAYYRAIGLPRP